MLGELSQWHWIPQLELAGATHSVLHHATPLPMDSMAWTPDPFDFFGDASGPDMTPWTPARGRCVRPQESCLRSRGPLGPLCGRSSPLQLWPA